MARSTWSSYTNMLEWITNVSPSTAPCPVSYSSAILAFSHGWAAHGYPVPADFDNPDALPSSENDRRYASTRGPGDGPATVRAVTRCTAVVSFDFATTSRGTPYENERLDWMVLQAFA